MTAHSASSLPGRIRASLLAEAEALAVREAFLAELLRWTVSDGGGLADVVARRLSALLHQPGIPQGDLLALMSEVLALAPHIEDSIAHDLQAVQARDPACRTYLQAVMNLKGFQALQAYRFAHALWNAGRPELASWLSNRVSVVLGPDIHPAARLGKGVMLDHGSGIVIGETAVVEDDVSILQGVTLGGTGKDTGARHPVVRRGVMVGAGAKILGRVVIGTQSKVAAGSVVLKDVPERCTVAGVPARIVRLHGPQELPAAQMVQDI